MDQFMKDTRPIPTTQDDEDEVISPPPTAMEIASANIRDKMLKYEMGY